MGMLNAKKPDPIVYTAKGYAKIKQDVERLNTERSAVLIRLQAAREMGDLSENGAYHAAKFELGSIDRQLRQLNYHVQYGVVHQAENKGVVEFGSMVGIASGSQKKTFHLVNKFESNPETGDLSVESPMGQAMLGKKINDSFIVHAPSGDQSYQIVSLG
jgi:transcription elongation factor GreA